MVQGMHNATFVMNRCVLNWFGDWSTGALYSVGKEFTNKIDLDRGNVRTTIFNMHRTFQLYGLKKGLKKTLLYI